MIDTEFDDADVAAWLDRLTPEQTVALHEMLAIAAKQIDDGDFVEFDVEHILADGRAHRAAQAATDAA